MIDDIYNRRILELAADIPRLGRLEAPDATATAHSKLCGSTVTVDLKLGADGVTIADFAHDVKACALGQASSSLLARHVVGASADELRAVRTRMRAMLKENGPVPDGKWADLAVLEPVRDFRARHASTLLTFDAVVDALDQIAARESRRPRGGLSPVVRQAAHGAIRAYQLTLSGLIGRQCRHWPSCSAYTDEAIQRHGLWAGGWIGVARICRCGPFGTHGIDLVPERLPERSAWHRPWSYGRWRGVEAPPPLTCEAVEDG